MLKTAGKLITDGGGSVAIEFAILGSIFFLLLFGQMETGFLLYQQHRLDDTTVVVSRSIQLGEVQRRQVQTAAQFKSDFVCPSLGRSFDCDRVVVDTAVQSDWGAAFDASAWSRTPVGGSPGQSSYCVASAGEYMFFRISYPQPPVVGSLLPETFFTRHDGEPVTMLQSFAALRIEPVGVGRAGEGCNA